MLKQCNIYVICTWVGFAGDLVFCQKKNVSFQQYSNIYCTTAWRCKTMSISGKLKHRSMTVLSSVDTPFINILNILFNAYYH